MELESTLNELLVTLAPPPGGGSKPNTVVFAATRQVVQCMQSLSARLAASEQREAKLQAEVAELKASKPTAATPATVTASFADTVKAGTKPAASRAVGQPAKQPSVPMASRKLPGSQPVQTKQVSQAPPPPTALRLQPLPGSKHVLASNRKAALEQLDEVLSENYLVDGVGVLQVYPPKAPQDAACKTGKQSKPGMVFTMFPVQASRLLATLRIQGNAEHLRSRGWSIRPHLPVEQYRCKCALYNQHKAQLQGKEFHFEKQYTRLVVEGGPTYQLSDEQLEAIRA